MLKRSAWLKDPFFHFCILGGLIFFVVKGNKPSEEERRIEIDTALFTSLNQSFEDLYDRQPTATETEDWLGRYIDEEVLYREALSLGLHDVDLVVRRQMVQSMRVLLEEPVSDVPIPDEVLEEYLLAHAERYQIQGRYSFEQVFLEGEEALRQVEAGQLLIQLRAGEVSPPVGDSFLHGIRFVQWAQDRIEVGFGAQFREQLDLLPLGEWQGPVESSYGLHLVHIAERILPRSGSLEEARELVSMELRAERRTEQIQEALSRLRESYVIERSYEQLVDR
jgi:hypothetical protein